MKNKVLKFTFVLASSLFSALAWPQNAAPAQAVDQNFWQNAFGSLVLFGGALVIAAAFYAIVRLFLVSLKMQELQMLREKDIEEVVETYRAPQESWWSRLNKILTRRVPMEQEGEIVLSHNYDGIRELDNKLPPWWLGMFYVSIVFAAIYLFAFHLSDIGPSSKEQYDQEMEKAKAEVAAFVATQAEQIDETNVTALTDEAELSLGKSIFTTTCGTCHGQLGEGGVGPNLTDDYWIHGGGIQNVFKTIKIGVPEKGMISWAEQLRASDIQRVASYILTLKGTNPPNAKAPQGDLYNPEVAAAPQDTTKTSQ